MQDLFEIILTPDPRNPTLVVAMVVAFTVICLLLGAIGLYASRDRSAVRMRALQDAGANPAQSVLMRKPDRQPNGWKKALIPADASDRAQIQFQLAKVGFDHAGAVEMFFVLRLGLAALVPVLVAMALGLSRAGLLPDGLMSAVQTSSSLRLLQVAAVGAAAGFYGPGYWLKSRIAARQQAIRNGFPNALDLLQISVEAGLGFDAALIRVGEALAPVAPEISQEFRLLRHEVQAGADRERAMFAMADRMGIAEAKSFVLVITQSMQFGTSLTTALRNYAIEMRINRELVAQEKANKLPVKMSAVMSVLMLPSLFLITLTPIIIRYMAIY